MAAFCHRFGFEPPEQGQLRRECGTGDAIGRNLPKRNNRSVQDPIIRAPVILP